MNENEIKEKLTNILFEKFKYYNLKYEYNANKIEYIASIFATFFGIQINGKKILENIKKKRAKRFDVEKEAKEKQKEDNKKQKFVALNFLLSKKVDRDIAEGFILVRNKKKTIITERVIKSIEIEAKKCNISLNDALGICIDRGWSTFKCHWGDNSNKNSKQVQLNKTINNYI